MKKIVFGLLVIFSLQSCDDGQIPDPDPKPFDGVNFTIDITKSPYTALTNVGGSVIVKEYDVIIARLTNADWFAMQSYCPNDAKTDLVFKMDFTNAANSTFQCPKDNTVYSYNGAVLSGTSDPLKSYFTSFSVNSNSLRVFE